VSVPTKSSKTGVEDSILPPGQRDDSGFWYPSGYSDAGTLVRPRQRRRKNGSAEMERSAPERTGTGNRGH